MPVFIRLGGALIVPAVIGGVSLVLSNTQKQVAQEELRQQLTGRLLDEIAVSIMSLVEVQSDLSRADKTLSDPCFPSSPNECERTCVDAVHRVDDAITRLSWDAPVLPIGAGTKTAIDDLKENYWSTHARGALVESCAKFGDPTSIERRNAAMSRYRGAANKAVCCLFQDARQFRRNALKDADVAEPVASTLTASLDRLMTQGYCAIECPVSDGLGVKTVSAGSLD